jgi:hypothetical protein
MRRLLVALGIAMAVGFGVVVFKAVQQRATGDSTITRITPTATASPGVPASTAAPPSARKDKMAAVKAAGDALQNLTSAFLKNNNERWLVVKATVVTHYRRRYSRQMNQSANPSSSNKAFWGTCDGCWGYTSRLKALVNAKFSADVQYYHVDKFRPGNAQVALYFVTTYMDADGTDHPSVNMQVLTMWWAHKQWLYVRQRNVAKNRTPGIKPSDLQSSQNPAGLTPKEVAELYKPYLEPKGFAKYPN